MTDLYRVGGNPLCNIKLEFYTYGDDITFTNSLMVHGGVAENAYNEFYFLPLPVNFKVYAYSIFNDLDGSTTDDGITVTIQVVKATGENSQTATNQGSAESITMTDGYGFRGKELFATQPTFLAGESIGLKITTNQAASNEIGIWLWCYQYA